MWWSSLVNGSILQCQIIDRSKCLTIDNYACQIGVKSLVLHEHICYWQWQWQGISFIVMHHIQNTAFHTRSCSYYYCFHLICLTSDNHTWQKGLEIMAHVPQYLLYNAMSKGARKQTKSTVQAQYIAVHSCLVTNQQLHCWSAIIYIP